LDAHSDGLDMENFSFLIMFEKLLRATNDFFMSVRPAVCLHGTTRFPLEEFSLNLTHRRLMSYIYMEHLFLMFLDHTQRRSTVGRTPLDE